MGYFFLPSTSPSLHHTHTHTHTHACTRTPHRHTRMSAALLQGSLHDRWIWSPVTAPASQEGGGRVTFICCWHLNTRPLGTLDGRVTWFRAGFMYSWGPRVSSVKTHHGLYQHLLPSFSPNGLIFYLFFLIFVFSGPHPQHREVPRPRDRIGATAASLCQSHSNARPEPCL